eukprot:1515013-Rhodomonas_salina.1
MLPAGAARGSAGGLWQRAGAPAPSRPRTSPRCSTLRATQITPCIRRRSHAASHSEPPSSPTLERQRIAAHAKGAGSAYMQEDVRR